MTICHSATANTGKPVLLVNLYCMEDNKENKSQAIIEIIDFGPLKISGNFLLKDLKRGKEESLVEVKLCICGKSGNKPYCDESHKNK